MSVDNLTTRVRQELANRGTVVSDSQIEQILKDNEITTSSRNVGIPFSTGPISTKDKQESKGSVLNAVGAGLWSALDTAAFGLPGAFVKEEEFIDFEDTAAKYASALGGLAGFIAGAPIKIGAKAVGMIAKPFIKKAGFESLESVTRGMIKSSVKHGVPKKQAKQIVNNYKKLAHKAQIDKDFAANFGDKATKLLVNYTDDAVKLGDITQKEAVAIKKMFGDNYTKRPIQDFIGLMAERGIAKVNPRFARVLGHAMNDSIMFGLIDTVFEGVSVIEDGHFDWTAPIWGAATGVAFSQISWLNPVGKGSKWFPDFKQGIRASFGRANPYKNMSKDALSSRSNFFGESLSRIEGGSKVVKISDGKKDITVNLSADNIFERLDYAFGSENSKKILSDFLDTQRKTFGKEMIKWATAEGAQNLSKNWMRMALGGTLFNFHTLADMAISGHKPDIHDILPHFLIGAFLQHGKNPAKFDLNSTKMNQLRDNLRTLGFETRQLTDIPSFKYIKSRFGTGLDSEKHRETLRLADEMTIGSDVDGIVNTTLREGEVSAHVQSSTKFDILYNRLEGNHYKYMKNKDNISTTEANNLVKTFEKETGLKTVDQYERHFDELSVKSTEGFENNLIEVIERVYEEDSLQEVGIVKDGKGNYQLPETLVVSESIFEMAERGELSFITGQASDVLKGSLAKEKLQEKIDGFWAVSRVASVIMEKTKSMPYGKTASSIKDVKTIESIYKIIESAELNVNEAFQNKGSSVDPFTFIGSLNDYTQIIGRNNAIKSSRKIMDIFSISPDTIKKSELISHMNSSGLIANLTGERMNLRDVDKIDIEFPEGTPQSVVDKRKPELRRALRRISMLQSISGGYGKSEDMSIKKIQSEGVEQLMNFMTESGLRIETMPSWLHEDVINFILRDKIGKSGLSLENMRSFMEITESGMAEFNLDMKGESQGFNIYTVDVNFVPDGLKEMAIEYNQWVMNIQKDSNGLINVSGKKKVLNSNEIQLLHSQIVSSSEGVSAQSALLEFIKKLPTNTGFSHDIGQYIIEGGSRDVIRWLISQGVVNYNRKSKSGWDVNIETFNESLQANLHKKIKLEGFTPEYVKSIYEDHNEAARAAYDEAYSVESSSKFSLNNFLEKYNFDGLDYSKESKESKKRLMKELFLNIDTIQSPDEFIEKGFEVTGTPLFSVIDSILKRVEVKNTSGDWVTFDSVPKAERESVRIGIARDIVKLVPSQYTSIRVNSFKYENGRVTEGETFQQQTRQTSLYQEWGMPYITVERDAVLYDLYNGRVMRRFFDIFGESRDLPGWENQSIETHRSVFESSILTTKSSFGMEHKDGMSLMFISKDTSPIAISKSYLNKMDSHYIKLADKLLKNDNINNKVKDVIRGISDKMKNDDMTPTTSEYNVALSQLTFADMLLGKNNSKRFEQFLNSEMDMDKGMGRIKLYDSKNFVKSDKNMLFTMQNLYQYTFKDAKTTKAINKIFKQDGFGVAIWNDEKYSTIEKELKSQGIEWDMKNQVVSVHGKVSSFDSIAYVSRDMMRYGHAMMGNNPNSTNPYKPVISSGGRSGPLLMGKTLFVYAENMDSFFEINKGVDIVLANSGAKMFNQGKLTDNGLDSSLINKPFNSIGSKVPIGRQKIRLIPIDALGLKPEKDALLKTAPESQPDYTYMTNDESGKVFRDSFEKDINRSVESMKSIMSDPIRIRQFIEMSFGEEGMSVDPSNGGGSHINNLAFFASLSKDANPMSYSDSMVKNKLYNVFVNSIMNGKRSSVDIENNSKARFGGQAYIIQVPDASYRLKGTIVDSEGKMINRGEIMISENESFVSVSDMVKGGKEMRFVDNDKVMTGKELFGKEGWDEIIRTGVDLGTLHEIIEYDKSIGKTGENIQIGIIVNRKPRTRPNDMMLLGLKGFIPKSYGRAAIVNSVDVVNVFEGDYDADKVDYFYGHSKSMFDHVQRTSGLFVQAVDPSQFKIKSDFSWGKSPSSIIGDIKNMSANAVLSKKAIGVVQNLTRKLQFINNLSSRGPEDQSLSDKFKEEGRETPPKVLLYTHNPDGGKYRIVIDFDNLDSYQRSALETQYMIDLAGGANSELMGNIRNWSDSYLFPERENSRTVTDAKQSGIGYIKEDVRKGVNSKRIRIFRKFNGNGEEQFVLTSLEKDMIKTMMAEYGGLLNVSGEKTFASGGENRSMGYDDMYSASDKFFLFNKDLSNSLYYKLWWKKDASGNQYYKDNQFKEMFKPESSIYKGPDGKDKTSYYPGADIFDGMGIGIKNNAIKIYEGKRGGVLERSFRPIWESDIFENSTKKNTTNNSSVTTLMTGEMDSWYQQLMSGEISTYSGSVDAMQANIMKTVSDYNSAAYYIGKLKSNIIRTNNNNNLSYKAKLAIESKLDDTINEVQKRVKELAPQKFWETHKSKDLTKFTFEPVESSDVKDGVVQHYVTDNLIKISGRVDDAGRKKIQAIKDIRKMFYGNFTDLGDIRKYDNKSVLDRAELDFLSNMPDRTLFYEIEHEMLLDGHASHGSRFILEFMHSARNDYSIGIKNGQLLPMPYGKTGRYKRGLHFLTKVANKTVYDDNRIQVLGESVSNEAQTLLKMLQTIEANHRRFMDNKFDMRNLSDPDYTVEIGEGLRFGIENIRIPNFSRDLSRVIGDFDSIQWARGTSRNGAGFKPMNDNYLSFYSDIMELSGRSDEFKKYIDSMNGLKSDMIDNKVIDPIEYLAVRSTIENDLKKIASDVLSSGVMESGDKILISRIKNNPVYILNGGGQGEGFFSGRSLETNLEYNIKKLRDVVRVANELDASEDVFRFKSEKSEQDMLRIRENCGG